jgi:hypothetical protein
MPKWGDSTRLWGALDYTYGVDGTNPGGELQWIFLVDWDNNNTFNYNEATFLVDLETSRGERYFVKPGGNGFEVMRPGEGTATLTDKDGRFDPDNAAGPLYGKILPGRKFRLMVKDIAGDTIYPVMAGFIYDIPPITEMDKIQLSLRESMSLLDRKVSIPILYRNSISDAIAALVNNARWPACFGAVIDDEPQQVTTFAVDAINALDTMLELGAASLGQVFSDAAGRLKFYNRGHSTMPSVAVDQAHALKQIRRSQPWENQRNIIQIIANKKLKAREAAIWQSGQPILVAGAAAVTISVNYEPAIDVRVYRMSANTLVTGDGTNKTSSVTYDLQAYSKSLSITLTNSFASDVFVSLIITGRPIVDQAIMAQVTNALTTETVFELDNPWLQDLSHAQAYATMISNFLDETQRTVEVQIEQRPSLQFAIDLMDAIPLTIAKLAIDTTYYAGLIEHRWQAQNGQAVTTTLVLRPRLTDATAISNDAEDPDLPYIPEPDLPPGGFPIDIPVTPPNDPPVDPNDPGGCSTNPDALPNGPWNLLRNPITLQSNGTYSYDIQLGSAVARPAGFTNPTKIAITGDWLKWDAAASAWAGNVDPIWWRVAMNGIYLTKGVYTDGGIGTRVLTVDLGGAQLINNIRLDVNPNLGFGDVVFDFSEYAENWEFGDSKPGTGLGAPLATGTWEPGLVKITSPGNWYQGSWSYTPTAPYTMSANSTINFAATVPGSSFTGGWIDYTDGISTSTLQATLNTDFSLGVLTGKMITKIWFTTVTYNNSVTLQSVVLTDVDNTPGSIYKWGIRGVALYNVCG